MTAIDKVSSNISESQALLTRIFSAVKSKQELDEIRSVIIEYYSNKIETEANKIIKKKGLKKTNFYKLAKSHIVRKSK